MPTLVALALRQTSNTNIYCQRQCCFTDCIPWDEPTGFFVQASIYGPSTKLRKVMYAASLCGLFIASTASWYARRVAA